MVFASTPSASTTTYGAMTSASARGTSTQATATTRAMPASGRRRIDQCDRSLLAVDAESAAGSLTLGTIGVDHDAWVELRIVDDLWPLWDRVVASTLEFSGIRLRNAGRSRV